MQKDGQSLEDFHYSPFSVARGLTAFSIPNIEETYVSFDMKKTVTNCLQQPPTTATEDEFHCILEWRQVVAKDPVGEEK